MSGEIARLFVIIGAKTDEFQQKMDGVNKVMGTVGKSVTTVGAVMSAGLTAPIVAAGTAIFGAATKAGSFADELLGLSAATGANTDQLQRWRYMAVAAGVDSDAVAGALSSMNKQMVEGTTFGKKLEKTAEGYGVALRDANGNVRDSTDVIHDLMKAISAIEDPVERARAGAQAFGGDWDAIASIVDLGSAAIDEFNQKEVISQAQLEAADNFRQQMDLLKHELAMTGMELATKLIPVMEQLMPIIQDSIVPAIINLVEWIGKAAEWFGKLSPGTQSAIVSFFGLLAAIGPVLVVVGKIIPIVMAVIGVIGKIVVAVKTVGAVMLALSGPIGWVIAAVIALIAIGILLYKNWDEVKAKAAEIWGAIKAKVGEAIEGIKGIINNAIAWLKGIPGQMLSIGKAIIQGLINGIKSMIGAAVDAVKAVGSAILGGIKKVLGISSPSKMFQMQVGVPMVEGIIKGIEQMRAQVGNALATVTQLPQIQAPQIALAGAGSIGASVSPAGDRVSIHVEKMQVRDEADIQHIAKELYRLQKRRDRGV